MSEGDARFTVEVFPRRYVTPFGVPGVPTRCHVLHELSRPIDLGELAFEDEGVPLDLTRRLENSGERAGVTRVKRISPTAAAFTPTAIRGPFVELRLL
jgi:hypothetical protein